MREMKFTKNRFGQQQQLTKHHNIVLTKRAKSKP